MSLRWMIPSAVLAELRNETIERCARACEERAWTREGSRYFGAEINCINCAAAIRALKLEPPPSSVGGRTE